jgi:hypothetical protein
MFQATKIGCMSGRLANEFAPTGIFNASGIRTTSLFNPWSAIRIQIDRTLQQPRANV